MRSQTLIHAQEQVGQGGPRIAPFETEKSEAEALSEKRLYARRKRRHEEALGTQDTKTEQQLFDKEVSDAALEWSDGVRQPGTDLREYVKLVTPAGKLTKEVAKDLLQRLQLPVKTEMGVLLQLMYKHYFYGSETAVPTVDKKDASNKGLFALLRNSVYAGTNAATSNGALVASVYTSFKRLMNDPSTFDTASIQTRNRVQGDPAKPASAYILPIPKTK
jgi:hypothetical protein